LSGASQQGRVAVAALTDKSSTNSMTLKSGKEVDDRRRSWKATHDEGVSLSSQRRSAGGAHVEHKLFVITCHV
jgi:hypothetical protein